MRNRILIRKGIVLLLVFFALSALVAVALSVILQPKSPFYSIFLYAFSVSQLFLFLHSLLYLYYTSSKTELPEKIEKRDTDFDKKTLTIVSAYQESEEVLKPTFDAIQKSFTGHVLLAVDSPNNVSSYIDLCRNHNVICIHRINRSGFKAGAINNVVMNFLENQQDYISKTKRIISDEIVNAENNSPKTILDTRDYLQSVDNNLVMIDKSLRLSRNNLIFQHISHLTAKNNDEYLHPKNFDLLYSNIEQLREKISSVISGYETSYAHLFTLSKIIQPINDGISLLAPEIDYLEMEVKSTSSQVTSQSIVQILSKTNDCLLILKSINDKKLLAYKNRKEELFSTMQSAQQIIEDVLEQVTLLEKNKSSHNKNDQFLYENRLKTLQSNLRSISSTLSLMDTSTKAAKDELIFQKVSSLIKGSNSDDLLPKDIDLLKEIIENNVQKINELDILVASLYTENLPLESLSHSSSLKKLNSLSSKIKTLESMIGHRIGKHNSDNDLAISLKNNRAKLDEINKKINLLYEEHLYGSLEQLAHNRKFDPQKIQNSETMSSKMHDLQKDLNDFNDLAKSLSVTDFVDDLEKNLNKITDKPDIELSVRDTTHNSHVIDLVTEFDYVVNDLSSYLPLNIENIVLFDSDAHPKSDLKPENNFFDLCAQHIQENNLVIFPQFYDKTQGNMARAAYAQQVPFMKTIMPKRSKDNSAFMLGTNIMIKKNTLTGVNGFDESTVTEDLATTIKIHESNAKSKFVNNDAVVNGAPLSIKGYFAQQQRWAYGTFQVFLSMLMHDIGNNMNFKKYIEYLYGNTWYFYGLAFLFNALIPVYSLIWEGLIEIPEEYFFFLYLPYVFSGMIIFLYSVFRSGHGLGDVYYNISLNAICFYTYIKSLFLVVSGRKLAFEVTPKSGSTEEKIAYYKKILPIVVVIGLLASAVVIYSVKILNDDIYLMTGLVNIIWSLFFISQLSVVFRFK